MHWSIVDVQPRKRYRLFIRFADGLSGEVDVSRLAGKGVFKAWKKRGFFEKVYIDPESQTVCWPGDIDLAPDALYEDVKKKQKGSRISLRNTRRHNKPIKNERRRSFPSIVDVRFQKGLMHVSLDDGRIISVPINWFPRLAHAKPGQRKQYNIMPFGMGFIGLRLMRT